MADHSSPGTIGGWSAFELEQFIRSKLQADPTMLPANLKHDVLDVRHELRVGNLAITPHHKGFIYGAQQSTGASQTIPDDTNPHAVTFSKTNLADSPRVKPNPADPTWVQTIAPYSSVRINLGGWYLFGGGVAWVANGAGARSVWVGTNAPSGAGLFGMGGRSTISPAPAGTATIHITSGVDYYTAGTVLSLWAQQSSGGNLNLVTASTGNFLYGIRLNLDSNS